MIKKIHIAPIKTIFKIIFVCISLFCLIINPENIGQGVRNGLLLLSENIIPSLFPFMILSTYIAFSPFIMKIGKLINKPAEKIFNVSGMGLIGVLLGITGGYPIGAKIISDFYLNKTITKNEMQRLFCWCVNPSPAFVITAIGTFMLKSTTSGVIIYISIILASLSLGVFTGAISKKEHNTLQLPSLIDNKNIFVNSVTSASKAMLSICAWVIVFSAISAGIDIVITEEYFALFIKSVAEVTTGCQNVILHKFSLPVLSAVLSFGGFAVIFQIAPYLEKCGYELKYFICWRIVSGALSAFYCSVLFRLFPRTTEVFQVIEFNNTELFFSHSTIATIFLLFTCIVLILEVDNKKKLC